jgi:hypothetical protein
MLDGLRVGLISNHGYRADCVMCWRLVVDLALFRLFMRWLEQNRRTVIWAGKRHTLCASTIHVRSGIAQWLWCVSYARREW